MHPLTLRDITKHPRIAVLIVDAFGGVMVRRREFTLTAKQVEKQSKPGRYGKIQFTRGPVTFYYEQIGLKI